MAARLMKNCEERIGKQSTQEHSIYMYDVHNSESHLLLCIKIYKHVVSGCLRINHVQYGINIIIVGLPTGM